MIFTISFYIFSLFLSYQDYKRYLVPNTTVGTLFIFLLIFGILEDKLLFSSIIAAGLILIFFIMLILIKPKMQLGGGDIKYIVVTAIFLPPLEFVYFLVITGVVQTLALLAVRVLYDRSYAAMVPAMLLSVVLTKILFKINMLPI